MKIPYQDMSQGPERDKPEVRKTLFESLSHRDNHVRIERTGDDPAKVEFIERLKSKWGQA